MSKTFVILTPGFPADENDSACLPFIQSFVKNFSYSNQDCTICILAFQYPFHKTNYSWNGIEVISFHGKNIGGVQRILMWIRVWHHLKKIKKENEIVGLLSFWLGECALLGTYFSKLYSLKHFCWLQGQDAKKGNRYLHLIKPKPDFLIAISDFIAQTFFENYAIHIPNIITSGIDKSVYATEIKNRDIDIIGAGSLIPLKRYAFFIDIIFEIKKRLPELKVLLCGKGFEKEVLQKQIDKLNLNKTVSLTGELPHYDLLKMMQQSKLFLHTSAYEGYSTVCAEALYAGCRVISFNKPMNYAIENWEIVKDKNDAIDYCIDLLKDPGIQFYSVLTGTIEDTVKKILALYHT
jgi:glycosyltransferase involved in cell wall biosynthesis